MHTPAPPKAFTLVETVLAMGIVAFAMVGILGLIPVGLTSFREAVSIAAESQIVQSISNDLLLTKYETMVDDYQKPQTYYFSDEGRQLVDADSFGCTFTVTVSLADARAPDLDLGAGKTVVIAIKKAAAPNVIKKHSLFIPRG